jgi:hypothetical protein
MMLKLEDIDSRSSYQAPKNCLSPLDVNSHNLYYTFQSTLSTLHWAIFLAATAAIGRHTMSLMQMEAKERRGKGAKAIELTKCTRPVGQPQVDTRG